MARGPAQRRAWLRTLCADVIDGPAPTSESSSERTPQAGRGAGTPGPTALRSRGGLFGLPLWARWVLSLGVVLSLAVALVLFVEHHGPNAQTSGSPAAVVRANNEAEVLVEQDQAPHVVRLGAGAAPAAALERALHAQMAHQIALGQIGGPLGRSTCHSTGAGAGGRRAYVCRVLAAHVSYPFFAVTDTRTHQITYCKRDAPPIPSENIPVSRRCLA
jgi:hypothetical protein